MPGPQRTPTEKLLRAGLRRGKQRARAAKGLPAKPELPSAKPRPLRSLRDLIATIPGYDPYRDAGDCRFDEPAARHAIGWIETQLRHVKGEKRGHIFQLEDWQRALVANIFGWKNPEGTRRYRRVWLYVPRKNGKTPLAACLLLYCLFEDGEPGAEVYGAASEYKQASLVFEHARGMVHQNETLSELADVYKGQSKAIQLKEDWSTYRVVASDAGSLHGTNTHAYVVDEVHTQPDSELVDVLETSTGARRQPLGIYITTADYVRESVCNKMYDYACRVRDGIIVDPTFLPCIFEVPSESDWTSEDTWRVANPNLGVSVSLEYLRTACKKAQEEPAFENTFKRLHLNIRTEQDVRWLAMDAWDRCAGEVLTLESLAGMDCWCGLDLATTRDLTAFVLAAPVDDLIHIVPVFWIPGDTARQRERRDRVPYTQWIRDGLIRETPGNATDYAAVRRDINALIDDYDISIREIAADRLFQGAQLCAELREQDGFDVLAFGQGFLGMAAATKSFEEAVKGGIIRHGGNPVLRWHASNVMVELDAAGNMKPSRKKSSEKIDGIVASIMAVYRAVVNRDQAEGPGIVLL